MPKRNAGKTDRGGDRPKWPPDHRLSCIWVSIAALAIIIVGSCLALDGQLLEGPFVFDDQVVVETNPEIQHIGMNLMTRRVGSELANMNYNDPSRPIVSLTFQLNYAWDGLKPWTFRVCNIILHWINALLVFVFVDTLYVAAGLQTGRHCFGARLSSLLTALLFLASPMNHSTAVYVFARSDIMGATGALTFTILGLRGFLSGEGSERWLFPRVPLMLFVLVYSLFSKQLTITAPVALGFLHLVLFSSQTAAVNGGGGCLTKFAFALVRSFKVHVLWMLALATYLGFRKIYFGSVGDIQGRLPLHIKALPWPWWCYQLSQPYALLRYLRTMVLPQGIALDHHIMESEHCMASFEIYCSVGVAAILLAMAFSLIIRITARGPVESFLLACLGWFGIHLLPTLVMKTIDVYCERRAYLSSAGVYAALVLAPFALLSRQTDPPNGTGSNGVAKVKPASDSSGAGRTLHAVAAVALLACFAAASRQLNPVYYSGESLWREVVRQYPESVRGRRNLGSHLVETLKSGLPCQGCEKEARSMFQSLLKIDSMDYDVMMSLARLESAVGKTMAAEQWYERILSIVPNYADAHFRLATSLHRRGGAYDKVLGHYQKALQLDPSITDLHNNLALLYAHTGQGRLARKVWAEGIAMWPQNALLLSNKHLIEAAPL